MAATYKAARDDLSNFATAAWNTAVAAISPTPPLFYDNLNQNPPDDGSVWGRLSIQNFDGTRSSLGSANARFRRIGMLFVQVFVPIGDGTLISDQIADSLVEAFEDAGAIGNIWFRDIGQREVGPDGTFHQVNVEVAFTFDRT